MNVFYSLGGKRFCLYEGYRHGTAFCSVAAVQVGSFVGSDKTEATEAIG